MSKLHIVHEHEASGVEGYWAYDYESQKWVSGEKALHLLIEQVKAELAILASDRAGEYWQMIRDKGVDKSCHDYVLELEGLLISYLNELLNIPTGEYLK